MVKMCIVVIFCLDTRQNRHKFSFLALQHSEVWKFRYWYRPISTVADTGQYIWEISKNAS